MLLKNTLKASVLSGDKLFGAWIETASVANTEILATAGFDFLIIDQEHGLGSISEAVDALRAAQAAGIGCVVRIPANDPIFLKRILDAGAQGVMVPMVETAAEAKAVVRACQYPPAGARGYAAPIVRASRYGSNDNYAKHANDDLLIIVQIESAPAVKQAAAIAAVDGVDIIFIGINDLAGSIGKLEKLHDAEVRELATEAEKAILASGKPMGTVPSDTISVKQLVDRGYSFIPCANDVSLLRSAALQTIDQIRQEVD
jgi:4-hydroxy-2-oxoheptanedioate aldolase